MRITKVAKASQITGRGRNETHVAGVGLDDDCRNSSVVRIEGLCDRVRVVERQHDGVMRDACRYPGRVGYAVGKRAAARGDQKCIRVPVVTARKLDDFVASGERA